jgi:hypothetical protein
MIGPWRRWRDLVIDLLRIGVIIDLHSGKIFVDYPTCEQS